MATTLKNIIAEVRTELVQYESAGMLDEISLTNWARRALKGFGNLITTLQEKTVEVKNSRAKLPEDFYSLYAAAKCEPYRIQMIKGDETELIDSLFVTIRTESNPVWDNQSNKFQDGEYTKIVEKTYLRGGTVEADLYYHSPKLLRLTRGIKKESCHSQCKNLSKELTYSSPYEINILGDYIQTNFSEGFIYLQFFALEKDEEGENTDQEQAGSDLLAPRRARCFSKKKQDKKHLLSQLFHIFSRKV